MRRLAWHLVAGALMVTPLLGGLAMAQQGNRPGQRSQGDQVTLVYDREVFSYRGRDRRDPFQPLTQGGQMGPRFQDLSLQGIIYSRVAGESVALLRGSGEQVFRVRVGDVVGNTRVIEIGPTRVVMAVENFGTIRQEILEMPQRGGAER